MRSTNRLYWILGGVPEDQGAGATILRPRLGPLGLSQYWESFNGQAPDESLFLPQFARVISLITEFDIWHSCQRVVLKTLIYILTSIHSSTLSLDLELEKEGGWQDAHSPAGAEGGGGGEQEARESEVKAPGGQCAGNENVTHCHPM